jgi:hypothetical protein
MVVWLEIETLVIGKGGAKGEWKRGAWVGEEVWAGVGKLTCVWEYFCCSSVGCSCQGLLRAGGVYSWYSS